MLPRHLTAPALCGGFFFTVVGMEVVLDFGGFSGSKRNVKVFKPSEVTITNPRLPAVRVFNNAGMPRSIVAEATEVFHILRMSDKLEVFDAVVLRIAVFVTNFKPVGYRAVVHHPD